MDYFHKWIKYKDYKGDVHSGFCVGYTDDRKLIIESEDFGTQFVSVNDIIKCDDMSSQPKEKTKNSLFRFLLRYYFIPMIILGALLVLFWYIDWYYMTYVVAATFVAFCISMVISIAFFDEIQYFAPGFSVLLIIVATFIYNGNDQARYISRRGHVLHTYEDCGALALASDVKKITKAQGWLHGYFRDCKVCEKSHFAKIEKEEAERISKQKEVDKKIERFERSMHQYQRYKLIDYLEFQIQQLKNGADPEYVPTEISNYYESECEKYKAAYGYYKLLQND